MTDQQIAGRALVMLRGVLRRQEARVTDDMWHRLACKQLEDGIEKCSNALDLVEDDKPRKS